MIGSASRDENFPLKQNQDSIDDDQIGDLEELTPEERKAKDLYYKSIFDKYDTNKTGFIELKELRQMVKSEDEVQQKIVESVFRISDSNNDDKIDFDEFSNMIQKKSYKKLLKNILTRPLVFFIIGGYLLHVQLDTYVQLLYIRFVIPRKNRSQDTSTARDGYYEEQYSCFPLPFGMVLISAFELACFLTDEYTENDSTLTGGGVTAQILIYSPYKRREVWRFLTYMLVHIGYVHLVVNLMVQILLGVALEMVHKWWRVLAVYSAGVIAGSLGTSISDPSTFLAGASGGVYALLTAHIATILMNWNEMSFAPVQLIIFLIIAGVDIGQSIYDRYFQNTTNRIGYVAHIAGAIAGLLVGIWLLKNFVPTKRETYLWWIALVIFMVLMGIMVILNIVWIDHIR